MFVSVKSLENSMGKIVVRPVPVACAASELEACDWEAAECLGSGNHCQGPRQSD